MRLTRASASALALALALAPHVARAGGACPAHAPHVLVVTTAAPKGLDVAGVLERLGDELAARGVTLCTRAGNGKPLAIVRIARAEPGPDARGDPAVALDIEVRDEVTQKRVGREIDVASVSADGRAVVVALAADELLRASWAELALERAPPPRVVLTPAVRAAIAPQPPPGRLSAGVAFVAEAWSGGLGLIGGDAELLVRAADFIGVGVAAGARVAPQTSSTHGDLMAEAAVLRLDATVTLARLARTAERPPLLFGLRGGAAAYLLSLHASAADGARAESHLAPALAFEVGPTLRIGLGDVGAALVVGGFVGIAARGVGLDDGGARVVALDGIGGGGSLGLAVGSP